MNRRFSFLAVAMAAVAALALSAPAHAGMVYSDSGCGSADVHGTTTGATVNTAAYTTDVISSINGNAISPTLALDVTMTLTGSGGIITGGTGSKDIDGTTITFTITDGLYAGHFIELNGTLGTVSGSTPGYDFTPLAGGAISISFSDTTVNFSNIIHHNNTSAIGTGIELQQSTVPEPASIAMLGIGMTGLLAIRRLFRRAKA
jgi:hypothetical protein